jgi:PBP1b-binding outer membrane lipoprotein LpoB
MKKMILAVLFSALVFAFGACASSAATEPVEEEVPAVEVEAEVPAEAAE